MAASTPPSPTPPGRRRSYIPHWSEYAEHAHGPLAGSVASVLGGFLIIVEGIVIAGEGGSLPSWLYYSLIPATPGFVGLVMIGAGLMIMWFGWLAYVLTSEHRVDAAAIYVVAFLLGFVTLTSAGFWIGSYLAFFGATHIFFWKPEPVGGADRIRAIAKDSR